ncbi:MAG: nucleotidyltransferase family protein [Candidatus Pacebacteria bacterium]|nr:nucleotidyltransferase family protein [Candidatus Paceibacterota bacterium]MCF7857505.1 nucleotidyltransferase family protein [Candidatus Paceibacterota bacterium]
MQCVILAAGNGKRLRPLTEDKPKQLVTVHGKPLIDYIVEALPSAIDELIIVVGYRGDMIREYCGEIFHGKRVTYIDQFVAEGTARALWLCKDLLKGRFLFMFGDDIHGREDLARAVSFVRSILVSSVTSPEKFGIVVRNPDGTLGLMIEKPEHAPSNCASTGAMVLDDHIFEFEPQTPVGDEYYLTEVIERYAQKYPIAVVEQNLWIPIGYPEDITKAETLLSVYKRI